VDIPTSEMENLVGEGGRIGENAKREIRAVGPSEGGLELRDGNVLGDVRVAAVEKETEKTLKLLVRI
jgi:hypothetical protein